MMLFLELKEKKKKADNLLEIMNNLNKHSVMPETDDLENITLFVYSFKFIITYI